MPTPKGEKSMDFLQGSLVYSAWFVFYLFPRATLPTLYRQSISFLTDNHFRYQYHCHTNSQLINLVQLTCAMLFDLALNKTLASTEGYEFFCDESQEKLARRKARTSDDEGSMQDVLLLSLCTPALEVITHFYLYLIHLADFRAKAVSIH